MDGEINDSRIETIEDRLAANYGEFEALAGEWRREWQRAMQRRAMRRQRERLAQMENAAEEAPPAA